MWDASKWMELEDFDLFGIFMELNVFGMVGTSYVFDIETTKVNAEELKADTL